MLVDYLVPLCEIHQLCLYSEQYITRPVRLMSLGKLLNEVKWMLSVVCNGLFFLTHFYKLEIWLKGLQYYIKVIFIKWKITITSKHSSLIYSVIYVYFYETVWKGLDVFCVTILLHLCVLSVFSFYVCVKESKKLAVHTHRKLYAILLYGRQY